MKLNYNVTGSERKALVGAVSKALNAPTKYLGAPTFSYGVGGYHIDKTGTLTGADNPDLKAALHLAGFDADGGDHEYDEPYYSNQEQSGENYHGAPDTLEVEYPLAGFTPESLDNLAKMVAAKEPLIKAALGADTLPIQRSDADGGKLIFPWFTLREPTDAAYYVQFIWALCKTAKEKKRVTAKGRELTDNPKYAMRCWLLSLGLIGDEYKNARKLLLARLEGNCSFKGGSRPTYTAHLYTYPNSEETDPMDSDTHEFTSLAKAKSCCDEFLSDCESLKFAGAHVEADDGTYLYEILTDGTVTEK